MLGNRSKGLGILTGPEGNSVEEETQQCRHCGKTVFIPRMGKPNDMGGLCYTCMGFVCPVCDTRKAQFGCDEVERKLDRAEKRHEALRSYGL